MMHRATTGASGRGLLLGHGSLSPGRALITYAWARTAYHALRSLTRIGVRCAVADSTRVGMSQLSRLAHRRFLYPPFTENEEGFVDAVNHALAAHGAAFLLPCHDETEVLARHRASLPANVILPIATAAGIELCNDKRETAALAARLGVPTPRTLTLASLSDLESLHVPWSGDSVVKLRCGNSAKGVFYANASSLKGVVREAVSRFSLASDRLPIIQERIDGVGCGVSSLYWEGQPIVSFCHRRLREKTSTGGTSTLREAWHNPVLVELAETILSHLKWHGLAMVEFKFDPATQQPWFIEINPRLWGSIALPIACGVDFPALLYVCATRGPLAARTLLPARPSSKRAKWYLGDVIVSLQNLKRGSLRGALTCLRREGAQVLDDLHADDPGAFAGEVLHYGGRFLRTRSTNPAAPGMLR